MNEIFFRFNSDYPKITFSEIEHTMYMIRRWSRISISVEELDNALNQSRFVNLVYLHQIITRELANNDINSQIYCVSVLLIVT